MQISMIDVDLLRGHADTLSPRAGGISPPADVIKSWPRPNYITPDEHNWTGTILVIVFLGVSVAVFIARIWARMAIAKNAGLDDLFIALSMVPLIGMTVAVVLGNRFYGYQWHVWDQTAQTAITARQIIFPIEINYLASTSLIKISILCFYRRMTSGSFTRKFIYWVWGSIVSVVAYFIAFTVAIIFTCTPIEGFWHMRDLKWRMTHELKCHNEGATIVAVVIVSTVQDFIICALPVFLVWNLQIPKRQKIALIAIFGMGLFTCVCGIMRTYYAIYVYYYTYDITWWAYYGWIWTALEAQLAVICASAPAMKIYFSRYFGSLSTKSSGYSYGRSGGRRTPGYSKGSAGHSLGTSQSGTGWDTEPVPLNQIKVSTGMNVVVENREPDDAASETSHSSTKNLTALPDQIRTASPGPNSDSFWTGSRTVCAAYRPGSKDSQNNSHDYDIERVGNRY